MARAPVAGRCTRPLRGRLRLTPAHPLPTLPRPARAGGGPPQRGYGAPGRDIRRGHRNSAAMRPCPGDCCCRPGDLVGHRRIARDPARVTPVGRSAELPGAGGKVVWLGERAVVLRGFARDQAPALAAAVTEIAAMAPFRNMVTPGGLRMSVAMTNCGHAGWITDRKGYRYEVVDPMTGEAWPPMPALFRRLAATAAEAAGFGGFEPDAC